MSDDRRLIEDYLPIEQISAEASGEPRTKGHLSTMHIWRARRPLVACRAAIYSALVSASGDRKENADFVARLCRYPGDLNVIREAARRIQLAHLVRLRNESPGGEQIGGVRGAEPRPKVLDPFSGGGAIPLEASRLGCESYAVELNPVAHLIELCTLQYPQEFGKDLADQIEEWGRWVLDRIKPAVADLYPETRLPGAETERQSKIGEYEADLNRPLSIVAYYWTRTVPCPNPTCQGIVPLYRQTWLRKKESGYVALRPRPDLLQRKVFFEVVEAKSEEDFGFNPGAGSEGSATACPFCSAAISGPYVRNYGDTTGFGEQLMCVIALNPHGSGKLYFVDDSLIEGETERQQQAEVLANALEVALGNSSLSEDIPPTGNAGLATGKSYLYGVRTFRQAFLPRQRCVLLTFAKEVQNSYAEMIGSGIPQDRAKAICTYLGLWLSRLTDRFNALSRWENGGEKIQGMTSLKRFAMAWDFPEVNIFGGGSGDALANLEYITAVVRQEGAFRNPTFCSRGSATDLRFEENTFDAVITDPPYYDNESYSELSDVCYVWLRPTLGFLYPEHFASALTPKGRECVAAAYRQGGTASAKTFYENCLFESLRQSFKILKPSGVLVMMYAHKTTSGWATLVDAIRRAGFEVSEAWPIETETKARVAHTGDAALASSIFLVARKRSDARVGRYEDEVGPELEAIVSERVGTLWDLGVSGADLVIACVGAGLRAFTRFERVEYGNGEEVPAERFLAEVETVVLEAILGRLSNAVRTDISRYSLNGVDSVTRFYLLWRYTYRSARVDAGEAIIFANGTHVELDGQGGLSGGPQRLMEKVKGQYRLLDFHERGNDASLGMPSAGGQPAPLVDALQRVLWLMDFQPSGITDFLQDARPNTEQMRLVAQALAGPALKGGELGKLSSENELAALGRLTANWRTVIEDSGFASKDDRLSGQQVISFVEDRN